MSVCEDAISVNSLDFDKKIRQNWEKERKPYSALFELTPKCNMDCVHCYLQDRHGDAYLSTDEIKKIIDVLCEAGILFLTLTGGEILTRKDIKDIYMYAKKKGFFVELFTNLTLLDDEMVSILNEYPPLIVDVSLYGASEDTYYRVTGLQGAYDRVTNNIRKLHDNNIRVALKCPVITISKNEMEKMKTFADSLGVPIRFTYEIINTIDGDSTPTAYQLDIKSALEMEFAQYVRIDTSMIKKKGEDVGSYEENVVNRDCLFRCNVGKGSLMIDYTGKMAPCMKLRHKGVKLSSENFNDIWKSFYVYSEMQAKKDYKCKTCKHSKYCDLCPAEMERLYGDANYIDESECKKSLAREMFYDDHKSMEEIFVSVGI